MACHDSGYEILNIFLLDGGQMNLFKVFANFDNDCVAVHNLNHLAGKFTVLNKGNFTILCIIK